MRLVASYSETTQTGTFIDGLPIGDRSANVFHHGVCRVDSGLSYLVFCTLMLDNKDIGI